MKLLLCPINGLRPVSEFAYGGEVPRRCPDPATCSDDAMGGLRVQSQRRAGRQEGMVVSHRRAASGSSPSAIPLPIRCCAPILCGEEAERMSSRLPPVPGEWIDRSQPLELSRSRAAATRASPATRSPARCWRSGVQRARAQLQVPPAARRAVAGQSRRQCAGARTGAHINLRADVTPLHRRHGPVRSQHLRRRRNATARGFSTSCRRFLPVGFYYKAFHSPKALVPALGADVPQS